MTRNLVGRELAGYAVEAQLGVGGMGEVYLARDVKLGRKVALKVLPAEVAADPERLARFEREARTVAALNHPNIVTLHSVEEADGLHFLTMELVEGGTLAEAIPPGGLALDRLLEIAVPLAEAVAAAHARGVVHRDLKPSNVMLTTDGRVKVLDFGLAKLRPQDDGEDLTLAGGEALTSAGQMMGTLPYMAPEQVRGETADPRTDLFSLGAVLYEMATGRRPFTGERTADLVSAILRDEPPPADEVRPDLPRHLARLIGLCLKKRPEDRLQTALDLRNELRELGTELTRERILESAGRPLPRSRRRGPSGLLLLAVLVAAAGGAGYLLWRSFAPERGAAAGEGTATAGPPAARRLAPLTFGEGLEEWPAWSPDGGRLVYSQEVDGFKNLFLQELGTGDVRQLTDGTHDDIQAAWAPDGSELLFVRANRADGKIEPSDIQGYYSDGDVWRLDPATGEERRVLEDAVHPSFFPDGERILFDADWAGPRRIWTAEASGRNPRQLTTDRSEEVFHTAPRASPDGRRIAFRTVATTGSDIALADAATGRHAPLTADEYNDLHPVWSPAGDALYFPSYRGGGMNVWRLRLADDGTAARAPEQITTGAGQDVQIAVSPDGSRLAFVVLQLNTDLWRLPLDPATGRATGEARAVVHTSREESRGAWTPDGTQIVFNSDREGDMNLYRVAAGGGEARQLTRGPGGDYQADVSPDGRTVAFFSSRGGGVDIWSVGIDGGEPARLTDHPALDLNPFFSPDGRSIAFMSDRSGRLEVWVMAADGSAPRQLTTTGIKSHFLRWTDDGTHILFTVAYASVAAGGDANVHRVAVDGGEATSVAHAASGGHLSLSPDRRSILDAAGHKALWIYPLGGGEPYEVFSFAHPEIRIDYPSWSPDGRWVVFDRVDPRGGDVWLLDGLDSGPTR